MPTPFYFNENSFSKEIPASPCMPNNTVRKFFLVANLNLLSYSLSPVPFRFFLDIKNKCSFILYITHPQIPTFSFVLIKLNNPKTFSPQVPGPNPLIVFMTLFRNFANFPMFLSSCHSPEWNPCKLANLYKYLLYENTAYIEQRENEPSSQESDILSTIK